MALSFALQLIAQKLSGEIAGDPDFPINGLAKIEEAGPSDLTFISNPKYKKYVAESHAGAFLVDKQFPVADYPGKNFIRVENPYFAFVKLLESFYPKAELLEEGISDKASIHPDAVIGTGVFIAPFVYIGEGCKVGKNTRIFPGVVLIRNVSVGDDCILYPNVSVREDCVIGNRVILHNGVVVGSDGFGFAFQEGKYHKIPQLGKVVIEDDVELGANCTIDRATLGETRIKSGTKLDNLVHIAHNVEVGSHTVMAAQTGVSGSTRVGNYVMLGGQVGVVGHVTIGDRVQVGAQSGVAREAKEGEILFGSPARPMMRTKRIEAVVNNLPELAKKVSQLEKKLQKLIQEED